MFVLKASLERDVLFMTELVLDRAILTPTILQTLLQENQLKLLVSLPAQPSAPKYSPPPYSIVRAKGEFRSLCYADIVETALHFNHKSSVVVQLVRLIQNQADPLGNSMDPDYPQLFSLFVVKRKVGLLRFLFSLPATQFKFTVQLFVRCLELEASDMAALIYKEFFR